VLDVGIGVLKLLIVRVSLCEKLAKWC